ERLAASELDAGLEGPRHVRRVVVDLGDDGRVVAGLQRAQTERLLLTEPDLLAHGRQLATDALHALTVADRRLGVPRAVLGRVLVVEAPAVEPVLQVVDLAVRQEPVEAELLELQAADESEELLRVDEVV